LGGHTGSNPTNRGQKGCKRHLITDAAGVPLVVQTTPANVHDCQPAIELLDRIPPVQGPRGRPKRRPTAFFGDHAYGSGDNLVDCYARNVKPFLAPTGRHGTLHGSGLGRVRYVVERTLAWFANNRRIRMCYERKGCHFQAFHELAAALIVAGKLGWSPWF
jgi:transposase